MFIEVLDLLIVYRTIGLTVFCWFFFGSMYITYVCMEIHNETALAEPLSNVCKPCDIFIKDDR